jgi:hypothetical protein
VTRPSFPLVALLALAAPLHAAWHPVHRFSAVHVDPAQPASLAAFLAAVPATVWHKGADTYQGVLTHDDLEQRPNAYLVADWGRFCSPSPTSAELFLVGEVTARTEAHLTARLGAAGRVHRVNGAAEEIAAFIATAAWKESEVAVLAPAVAAPVDEDIEAGANAAALASLHAAPLLFLTTEGPGAATREAMTKLGVRRVIVIDPARRLSADALAALAAHVTIDKMADSIPAVVALSRAAGGTPTLCLMQDAGKGAAAALAAARYRGTVHRVPQAVVEAARAAARAIPPAMLRSVQKLPRATDDEDETPSAAMVALAGRFHTWCKSVGAEDPSRLETVIDFAEGTVGTGFPLTFERAIHGDPRRPTDPGALVSRMPGNALEDIAYVNRSTLYPALIHVAPRPKRVTMSMVAIEVENTGPDCDLSYTDWEGVDHKPNEFYGTHTGGYDDPGVFESYVKKEYSVGFHNGRHEADGQDPVNAEKHWGFWKELQDGSTFLYSSSHGGVDEFYPLGADNGTVQENEYGQPYWPGPSGRVNVMGDTYTYQDLDREFDNLHSTITVFNACLVGGGRLNKTVMDHGGAGSISSYTSISFDGGGMWGCWLVDRLVQDGVTVGEAFAYATARASECFPRNQTDGDSSLRFVHFGDAAMEFVKPHWARPELLPPDGR